VTSSDEDMTDRASRTIAQQIDRYFGRFANASAHAAGTPVAFLVCLVAVLVWAATGPMFGYSETWQLVINTGTTIVTFLMVFLIQNSQNRDGAAIQTKLDELIRSSDAEDEFMGIEALTEAELMALHQRCEDAAHKTCELLTKTKREWERRRQNPTLPD
jgi:low affinity Fe/Cu permease